MFECACMFVYVHRVSYEPVHVGLGRCGSVAAGLGTEVDVRTGRPVLARPHILGHVRRSVGPQRPDVAVPITCLAHRHTPDEYMQTPIEKTYSKSTGSGSYPGLALASQEGVSKSLSLTKAGWHLFAVHHRIAAWWACCCHQYCPAM
jgi:hypothetical protein